MQDNSNLQAQNARRSRAVAALVLTASCLFIGFVGGRLSAWIVPAKSPFPAVTAIEDTRTSSLSKHANLPPTGSSPNKSVRIEPSATAKPDGTPGPELKKAALVAPSSAAPPVVLLNPGTTGRDAPKSSAEIQPREPVTANPARDVEERELARRRSMKRQHPDGEPAAESLKRLPPPSSDHRALRDYMLSR